MARIALAHPWLADGGSEARALWGAQALIDAGHRVTVLTFAAPSVLTALNAHHATSLRPEELGWRRVRYPAPTHGLMRLQWRWFERCCAAHARDFDLVVSAYNPMDIPGPALQFVADFSWDERASAALDPAAAPRGARRLLQRPYGWLTRPRRPASEWLRGHRLIANSRWTAARLRSLYGVEAHRVVYPPVMDAPPPAPKSDARRFLWLGRVAPEKRLEDAVAIIAGLRARGHDVELWVGGDLDASAYGRHLRRALRGKPWVRLLGYLWGERKIEALRHARFGLHTRPREPFGIAVAEMMKAGCLVFASADGGAGELLEGMPLRFSSVADAIDRVDALLGEPARWDELAVEIARRGQRYSIEAFRSQLVALVDELLGDERAR